MVERPSVAELAMIAVLILCAIAYIVQRMRGVPAGDDTGIAAIVLIMALLIVQQRRG